ncbi:cd74 molecule, major histocompatibility complex, class II invariant chain a [Desmophyllum pertusum]|uniref:Cd74 molecule, major histocompatibility complex, class II invariant chain a n=1 Tax=Desmophyllum pertusum TaxID=174260 RepID=A0A9W9YKU5_9CNID|nr:cd74 molecule, major histocompatibility complex, class II invariant chain a [Desmophyllum pertusum]
MGGCGAAACKPKSMTTWGRKYSVSQYVNRKLMKPPTLCALELSYPSVMQMESYARVQCWGSTGYCWCTSEDGTEWPGTRIRGTPNCDVNDGQLLT